MSKALISMALALDLAFGSCMADTMEKTPYDNESDYYEKLVVDEWIEEEWVVEVPKTVEVPKIVKEKKHVVSKGKESQNP